MTSRKSKLLNLPHIDRPESTRLERLGFYLQRNWKLVIVLGCIAGMTIALSVACLVAALLGYELSSARILTLLLMLLPLNYIPLFLKMYLESKPAQAWMVRVALACATYEERAFLFHQIRQRLTAERHNTPLSRGELLQVFNEARKRYGRTAMCKEERLSAALEAQSKELPARAFMTTGSTRSVRK